MAHLQEQPQCRARPVSQRLRIHRKIQAKLQLPPRSGLLSRRILFLLILFGSAKIRRRVDLLWPAADRARHQIQMEQRQHAQRPGQARDTPQALRSHFCAAREQPISRRARLSQEQRLPHAHRAAQARVAAELAHVSRRVVRRVRQVSRAEESRFRHAQVRGRGVSRRGEHCEWRGIADATTPRHQPVLDRAHAARVRLFRRESRGFSRGAPISGTCKSNI